MMRYYSKKMICFWMLILANVIFGQKKIIYLDDFNQSEIPEIPKAFQKSMPLSELCEEIYNNRKKSVGIDSLKYKYQIGLKNKRGLWFNSYYESVHDYYHICERFGNDIYNDPYGFNQVVFYYYDTKYKKISGEYAVKLHEKVHTLYTDTSLSYHDNGKLKSVESTVSFFGNEFNAGKWQLFNEKGKLIYEIDFDKKFALNFITVFNLLKDNFKEPGGTPFFKRVFNKKEALWICIFFSQVTLENRYIILNDRTKEIIIEDDPEKVEKYNFKDFEQKLVDGFLKKLQEINP